MSWMVVYLFFVLFYYDFDLLFVLIFCFWWRGSWGKYMRADGDRRILLFLKKKSILFS